MPKRIFLLINLIGQQFKINAPFLKILLTVTFATGLVAVFLDHTPGGVFNQIKLVAEWFKGGQKPEVVTWPAWGYAFLIAVIPSFTAVIILQASIGIFSLAVLLNRLCNRIPKQKIVLTIFFICAIPWHNLQVNLYPSALAGSFTLLAILSLDTSLCKNSTAYAILAGVFAGVSQNFRSEFFLLPLFIGICFSGLVLIRIVKRSAFKSLIIFIATAFVLQLPWMVFYHSQTGRYSLTESNMGHVLYASLGSVPDNRYGYKSDDGSASIPIREAGYSYSSLSENGNTFLRHLFIERAKENPVYIVQRTLQQLKNTILAPFGWGTPRLDEQGQLHMDVLREEIKSRLGVGVNVTELQNYRSLGLFSQARRDIAAIFVMIYLILVNIVGILVVLLGLLGILLLFARPELIPSMPLLYLLGSVAIYKILQDALLFYLVNYLSNVFPMFLPFVCISICFLKTHFQSIAKNFQKR